MENKKFVVYLVTYKGDKLPPYYIGSTSEDKIKKGYLGSIRSKKWKDIFNHEVSNNIEFFEINVLSRHETRELALLEEYKIQKERDVVNSNDYFNESLANVNGYFGRDVSGEVNPMHGRNGEVIAINVETGNKVRVSKEEFSDNVKLSGHTCGFVFVTENKSGDNVCISKDEYDNNKHKYTHHNKGKKHTKELKSKLSRMRKGFITAKDWDGNYHRVHKDDVRFKSGEFGNTNSKRWLIMDLEGNEYRVFGFRKFFDENNLQLPTKDNIDENGIIRFKNKPNKSRDKKTTNGWKVICLD